MRYEPTTQKWQLFASEVAALKKASGLLSAIDKVSEDEAIKELAQDMICKLDKILSMVKTPESKSDSSE